MTIYSYPFVINIKSMSKLSAMLVSPPYNIVAANDNTAALGGILLTYFVLIITR